jgi:uncharacterized protein (DUF58 family)
MKRAWGVASVFLPPILAGLVAFRAGGDKQLDVVGALVFMWWVMSATLIIRYLEMSNAKRDNRNALEQLDVLTGTGRAIMWAGLAALVLATKTGWASLSVIGILGIGTACVAATWAGIVAGGDLPWRTAQIRRTIVPRQTTEGEPLREELLLSGVRIPTGMRLFVQGRATLHAPMTRYCVSSDASGAELKLASEIGPAPRGDHTVPLLAFWLVDVLGIARTAVSYHGEAAFSAVPKPSKVDNARQLLGAGGDDQHTTPTHRMPTEGTFRIREYAPGDDARRIHWVRSLQANQLVVRLPDEIPQAEPAVRLVLDNCLAGTETLTCTAHDELLDSLVRIWIGVGNALAEAGTRVTLVTAAKNGEGLYHKVERALVSRSSRQALQLGARVAWQPSVPLAMLVGKPREIVRTIVVTSRPKPRLATPDLTWVIVPEVAFTGHGWQPLPNTLWMTLPFPAGSAENRWSRRRQQRKRILKQWDDRSELTMLLGGIDWSQYAGAFVARPREGGKVALEVVS